MSRNSSKRAANPWTIVVIIALAIAVIGAIYYYSDLQGKRNEPVLQTSTIGTGDIILTATGLGTLVPNDKVSLGFKNGGIVSEVLVRLGQQVQAGQVLARLDSTLLTLKYKQAEANLAALSSPAEIAKAAQAVQDAKESYLSSRDDLQSLIGPDLLMAQDRVASAQQDLQIARAALQEENSAQHQRQVTDAETALAKAEQELASAQKQYIGSYVPQTFTYVVRNDKGTTLGRQILAPTDTEIAVAQAAYDLAVANLNDAQDYLDVLNGVKTTSEVPASSVTPLSEAKLALDSAQADLEASELVAPTSGTVTSIDLNVGEEVGTSAVVTISNMNQPYTIDASLDETDWDKAKVGYTASVTFDLLPDENYAGQIVRVYPKLDDSSGTSMVHILVQLDKPIGVDLPVGSTASVDVTGGEALDVVLVPVSAVKEVGSGKYIVYRMDNGTPVEQEVEIGLQDIMYAEVKSGLQRGEVVLTDATAVAS